MRKITSKKDQAKKKKTNQIILGVFLVFIMLFSTVGFAFIGSPSKQKEKKIIYNGIEFIDQNGVWIVTIENYQFVFKNNPKEVEKIPGEIKYLDNYYRKPLYLSSDYKEAEREIIINLFNIQQMVERVQYACLNEENCSDSNLPIKTCENNFIIIKNSSEISIIQENNCVFISGPKENLTKITDEFLFKIMGIR